MKKSDELFKAALAAKADETQFAKSRVDRMAEHSTRNRDALRLAHSQALAFVEQKRQDRLNDLNRQIDLANSDANDLVRQMNALFQQMLDQEDTRLADYSMFNDELAGFVDKRKRNSAEVPKLQVVEGAESEKTEKTGTN